jgi:hypothetical protein
LLDKRFRGEAAMSVRSASTLAVLLAATSLVGAIARPAFADPRDVSVGGVWITRITQANGGYSPEQRAVEITRRITRVLGMPEFRQGAVVTVQQSGADALVQVGSVLIFTVTPADAAGSGTTMAVATQWATLLARGLSRALPGSNFHF